MIKVFNEAARRQKSGKAYAIVSDELAFDNLRKKTTLNFDIVLKEWELTKNVDRLAPSGNIRLPIDLWHAYYADRRLCYGIASKFYEDYSERYDELAINKLLCYSYEKVINILQNLCIDKVVCFLPTTFLDVIALKASDELGLKKAIIRGSKVDNFVVVADELDGSSVSVANAYEAADFSRNIVEQSHDYLSKACHGVKYEGTFIGVNRKILDFKILREQLGITFRYLLRYKLFLKPDPHIPNPFLGILGELTRYYRLMRNLSIMAKNQRDHKCGGYIFFPLHSEPEVALGLFGRGNLNQISVLERLSYHLPLGLILIIKEHPKTFSYRSAAWIKKVNAIPNVYYSVPEISTNELIENCEGVITISGFVGLEAVLKKKPVITLGETPINMLPNTMVTNIDLGNLSSTTIINAIEGYGYCKERLINFIAANMQVGKRLNIWSSMLGKHSRNADFEEDNAPFDALVKLIADE